MGSNKNPPQPSANGSAAAALPSASSSSSASTLFPAGSAFLDGRPLPRLFVFDLDYTLWPFWVDTHVTPPFKVVPAATVHGSAGVTVFRHASGRDRAVPTGDVVVDRVGETFGFYDEVPAILGALSTLGGPAKTKGSSSSSSSSDHIHVGVASRTSAPELARELLRLLYIPAPVSSSNSSSSSSSGSGLLSRHSHYANANGMTSSSSNSQATAMRKAVEAFDAGLEIYPSTKLRHMEALHKRTGIPYEQMLFFDDESRNRNVESLGVTMCLVRDGVTWAEIDRGVREWRKRRGHGR